MSILIKGMEMPTSCESCPCKTSDAFGGLGCQATGYIPLRKANQDRPDWCPFVPVPPHGRLIDADELRLLYDFSGYIPTGDMTEEEFDRLMCRLPVIRANIDDAPTIIEAEEKT